jgi:hypothetical protein
MFYSATSSGILLPFEQSKGMNQRGNNHYSQNEHEGDKDPFALKQDGDNTLQQSTI